MACQDPRLEAQLEYLRSDDRPRQRAPPPPGRAAAGGARAPLGAPRPPRPGGRGRARAARAAGRAGVTVAPPLDDPVAVAAWLAERLEADGIAYAIGGALALGAHGIPRMTDDVDLAVFAPEAQLDPLFDA